MKWLTLTSVVFLCWQTALSQSGQLSEEIKKRFPDESVVFLERSETLNLHLAGDSLKAYTDVYEDLLHLKNQTDGYANKRVYGSSFVQVDNLQAKTLVWEKNRYREVPITGWTKSSKPDDHVFYDDSYYYSFNYPSVASGNRTQLEYREIQKEIRLLSGFLFTTYAPQVRSRFTIKTPREVDLYFEVLNDPAKVVQFKKQEKGNIVTYEWFAENVPAMKVEDQSPAVRYYEPHVVCYVRSYRSKGKTISVIPDLKALHAWYRTFIRNLDEPPHPELTSVVNTIKQNNTSELAVVKNIFSWVQDNIQYIAFEDGMRGFVPHKASYTCEKRYGDCKDMATLVVGMLKIAGIRAYPTWIGTRDIPYRFSELPTPYVDNHMIATYISGDGKYYFLDATDQHIPFGFPSSMIQGKEALISMGEDQFEIREVPVMRAEDNLITDSLTVAIKDNFLTGQGSLSLQGLSKGAVGHEFARVEEKDIRDFVVRIAGKGNNKFYLDNYRFRNQLVKDRPTSIGYDFRIGDYFQRLGDELYINLNLSKDNYNRFINEDVRKTPHEFEFKYSKSEFIKFSIPDGYEVEYLPPNDSFDGKLIGYTISYEVSGNTIFFRKKHYVDYLMLGPSQFKTWNEEVSRISNAYQETIILKKKK